MAKPQYLVHDNKGPKLKRNVPKDIRHLAGKSAWIERVHGLPMAEIRKRANIFATRTDAEISALRRRGNLNADHQHASLPTSDVSLTDTEVQQIALRYFHQKDRAAILDGSYFVDAGNDDFHEIASNVGLDYADAVRAAAGDIPSHSVKTVVRILVENDVLSPSMLPKGRRFRVPENLRGQSWFKYLCSLIDEAEVELARRRLEAVQINHVPPARTLSFVKAPSEEQTAVRSRMVSPRKTVNDLVEAFLAKKAIEVGPSRQSQFQLPMRALKEELGGTFPVEEIVRKHCKDLVELFPTVPAYVGQQFKGMTLRDAAVAYEKRQGEPAKRHAEAAKHLAVLRQALEFAVKEEWIVDNPAMKVEVTRPERRAKKYEVKGETYQPFDIADLKAIFTGKFYRDPNAHPVNGLGPRTGKYEPHRFWAPLLALWTGA